MRIVYHAGNSLDARMIKDILAQAGIQAHVVGDYLQGGVGTLPALDLVKVLVTDADYATARDMIEAWISAGDAEGQS